MRNADLDDPSAFSKAEISVTRESPMISPLNRPAGSADGLEVRRQWKQRDAPLPLRLVISQLTPIDRTFAAWAISMSYVVSPMKARPPVLHPLPQAPGH